MIALRARVLAFAAVAAAACHGGPPAASPAASSGPTCAQVADSVMASMPQGAGELAVKLHQVIVQRCDQDKWTESARSCVVGAKTHQDAAACESQLTDDQKQALDRDGDAVIDDFRKHDPNAKDSDGAGAAPSPEPADNEAPGASTPPPPPAQAPPTAPARSSPRPDRESDPCAGGQ
jgi:hypothetical protein|nr:hypothetical protein [Kofleriaceae bacterium]